MQSVLPIAGIWGMQNLTERRAVVPSSPLEDWRPGRPITTAVIPFRYSGDGRWNEVRGSRWHRWTVISCNVTLLLSRGRAVTHGVPHLSQPALRPAHIFRDDPRRLLRVPVSPAAHTASLRRRHGCRRAGDEARRLRRGACHHSKELTPSPTIQFA